MFIHVVVFKILKKDVRQYMTDCRLWEREARKYPGFEACYTLKRDGEDDQYASYYAWRTRRDHDRFMKKNHDRLVSLSKCPVEVVGYFNFSPI
jgi:heme-degrading monooxygenase HmoA